MTDFVKYQHLERFGTSETEGITDGEVYAFYKIDGTNGSVWWCDKKNRMRFASRNRELDVENDNAGFMNTLKSDENLLSFFKVNPNLRLFGEWLVPHSLKTYREDAWRKFYVFDVYDMTTGEPLHYEAYKSLLEEANLLYIPPVCIFKNPDEEKLLSVLDKCGEFLVENGGGLGEGVVLKNYSYKNKYGRQTWAKLITNEFKEKHHKEMGAPLVLGTKLIEDEIVDEYLTEHFILKEKAKIENEKGEWQSKFIPMLLGIVYYELIKEEMWNILKKHKNPKINFSLLNKLVITKTKKVIGV